MKTILIIEDDDRYRTILSETLVQEGYTVFVAQNGEEGLVQVGKNHIDLILLDLVMPKVDGINFYYRLTSIVKKHVPIIILTNLSETKAYTADIKDILIKANVSLEDVVKKVKDYLQ